MSIRRRITRITTTEGRPNTRLTLFSKLLILAFLAYCTYRLLF